MKERQCGVPRASAEASGPRLQLSYVVRNTVLVVMKFIHSYARDTTL